MLGGLGRELVSPMTSKIVLNVAAVALLAVITVLVAMMPRVNYDAFFESQESLRSRFTALDELTDGYISSVRSLTTTVSNGIEENRESFDVLSESVQQLAVRVDALENELADLAAIADGSRAGTESGATPNPSDPINFTDLAQHFGIRYSDPIEVPEIVEQALGDAPHINLIPQEGFDRLLARMIGNGLIPVASDDELAVADRARFRDVYDRLLANIKLIDQQEGIHIEMLVQRANDRGDYVEIENTPEAQMAYWEMRKAEGRRGPGVSAGRESSDETRERKYWLTFPENPGLLEGDQLRSAVTRHFYRDIHLAGQQVAARS